MVALRRPVARWASKIEAEPAYPAARGTSGRAAAQPFLAPLLGLPRSADNTTRCTQCWSKPKRPSRWSREVRAEPRGVVRVSCPVALLELQFGALFAGFLADIRGRAAFGCDQSTGRCHRRGLRHRHPRALPAAGANRSCHAPAG